MVFLLPWLRVVEKELSSNQESDRQSQDSCHGNYLSQITHSSSVQCERQSAQQVDLLQHGKKTCSSSSAGQGECWEGGMGSISLPPRPYSDVILCG